MLKVGRSVVAASAGLVGAMAMAIALPAAAQQLERSLLDDLRFRAIGPSATGGRIIDIAVQSDRPTTIYAAAASGGLWKTINNGTTWDCVFENESSISIGDIALDPNDANTLWVGTGEANNQRSSYWGDGIYKSTDGGETWTNKGLPDSGHIGRIVISPDDSDTVYVAVAGHLYTHNAERGLYKTTDGGESWELVLHVSDAVGVIDVVLDPVEPDTIYAASYERLRRAWHFDGAGPGSAIYKSTDGGATWTLLEGGLPTGEIGRIGLTIYPSNPKILYATVSNQNPAPVEDEAAGDEPPQRSNRIGFQATFEEGGAKVAAVAEGGPADRAGLLVGDIIVRIGEQEMDNFWRLLQALSSIEPGATVALLLRRGEEELTITINVPQPQRRQPQRGGRQIGGEIYRTEDGGATWTRTNEQPVGGSPAYYYGQIRVDPSNDQNVYVLSVPCYGSSDGGKTFQSIAGSVHVDHHALWINPDHPDHLLLGNDGGFHATYDRGATWDHIFTLPLPQFYAIGFDYAQPYHVYGGTQDNGSHGGPSRSRGGGVGRFDWYRVGGGDGFYVEVDPTDSNVVYAESQFGGITRMNKTTGESKSIRPPRSDDGPRDRFNWMSPIVISHHNSRIIYFAGNRLFKSYDRGDNWHVISPDLTTADEEKIAGNVPHCTITTISESIFDPNMILVGTDDGNVQWTTDGGTSWTNMADRFDGVPANYWVSRVELSRHDRGTAYVSFTGYREDDLRPFVYRTTDRGETWDAIHSNLPEYSVNVVREDPVNAAVLYVGTETGVHVSIDGGGHWVELAGGIPTQPVHDLKIHPRDRDLIAGTHGRGLFILDDIVALQELSAEVLASDAHLFSARDAIMWRRTFGGGISGNRKFTAPDPPTGSMISYYLGADVEEDAISLKVLNARGELFRNLDVNREAGLHRINWDLRGEAPQRGDGGGQQARRQGFRGRGGGGRPMAAPGTYTVILQVGDETFEQTINVVPDPLPGAMAPAPGPEEDG